jgi:cytochrome d ubiquinol oxidase subunit I
MRTQEGISQRVPAGSAWFTLIGFLGMYMLLGILFLFLLYREIDRGPDLAVAVVPHAGGMQPAQN